jgi:hypothetical protein
MRLTDDDDEEMIPSEDPDKGWDDKPIFDNSSAGQRMKAENFKNFRM